MGNKLGSAAPLVTFTYLSVGFYMQAIGIASPWFNAIIPPPYSGFSKSSRGLLTRRRTVSLDNPSRF